MPHPQVGEATALVQVGEVAGEVHGVRLVDAGVRSGARRRGRCACAGLLCGVLHFWLLPLFSQTTERYRYYIRHWEVTATEGPKGFSFVFLDLFDIF